MPSRQQIDDYHRDGVLLVENVADRATLEVMRGALAELPLRRGSGR